MIRITHTLLEATANAIADSYGVTYAEVLDTLPAPLARTLGRRKANRADLGVIQHGLSVAHKLAPANDASPVLHAIRAAHSQLS